MQQGYNFEGLQSKDYNKFRFTVTTGGPSFNCEMIIIRNNRSWRMI